MKNLILILSFSLIHAAEALSCSCLIRGINSAIKHSDKIFVGKALKVDTVVIDTEYLAVYNLKFYFKVEAKLKGRIKDTIIEIFTGMGGGDCGYRFIIDSVYIVYAWSGKSKEWGKYNYTSICTRTRIKEVSELKEIRRLRKNPFLRISHLIGHSYYEMRRRWVLRRMN